MALLCGRYEGFDERVVEHLADETISIGRYVLAGGELPAMVISDAVLRKLPGALGDAESVVEESYSAALEGAPEYPALHPARRLPRLGGSRHPALGRSRPRAGVAARASPPAGRTKMNGRHKHRGRITASISRRCARPTGHAHFLSLRTGAVLGVAQAEPRPSAPHEHSHRRPREASAEAAAEVRRGRPRARPLPGGRGEPPPHPGLRGHRDQAPGQRRARDVHRPQAVLRRRRRADVPAALAEDREARGGRPRRRAAGEALLPAREGRQERPGRRAALGHRGRDGRCAGGRGGG